MKHTPGPWFIKDGLIYALNESGINQFFTGLCTQKGGAGNEELNANANLIAAAPDLLEALFEMENIFSPQTEAERLLLIKIRRAIKKAEGEL